MFNEGVSSSTLNLARSAISFFSSNSLRLKDDSTILRLFQFFYRKRPLQVKYLTYWPVRQLLNYLSELHPASSLSLKFLTLKTLALIALTSSDRGQTLHSIKIDNLVESETGIDFVVLDRLKTTRRVAKPKIVSCITSDIESLNVAEYLKCYLQRTLPLRRDALSNGFEEPKELFLSWKTKKAVTRQTLSRWLRTCLQLSGIDSKAYGGHSFRGSGLSSAFKNGASIQQIVKHGDWTNTNTFSRFYNAPERDSEVGQIILNQYKK